MKTIECFAIAFLFIHFSALGQEHVVSWEDRNQTVELTNQAINSFKENKTNDAYRFLTKAISIDSTFRPSFIFLYKVLIQNQDYAGKIISYLQKAKRIFQEDDEISFYMGEIYRVNNDIKNALKEYDEAIRYSKKNGEDFNLVPNYYFNRGNCYLKMDLIDSALADYNYSLKLKPEYSFSMINRGICFYKKKDYDNACHDWTKALELGCYSAKEYLEKYCKVNN